MHPALLPLYPGAHAVRDAVADGVPVIEPVDEGVDVKDGDEELAVSEDVGS
jgi:phosphoribosylglycinamide formyltransferase-1